MRVLGLCGPNSHRVRVVAAQVQVRVTTPAYEMKRQIRADSLMRAHRAVTRASNAGSDRFPDQLRSLRRGESGGIGLEVR